MDTRTVELPTADGPMDLYEAVPDSPNGAAVVVIQEAFGVNDHIEDVTRRFAAEGYRAVAPALFHRSGGGTAAYDDLATVMPLMQATTDDGVLVDVDATLDHLRAQGFTDDHIGVVGFCMGGRVSFLVSVSRSLGAAVGFYGGGIVTARNPASSPLVDRAGDLATPWLGLFGDRDRGIPVEDVETLRAALEPLPIPTEVVRYPDADHGFHCDARDSYHEPSATAAWARTLDWFDRHLATA